MTQLNDETSVKLTSVDKEASALKEASELLESGRKLVKEESYDSGIDQLSDALALMVENFGELDYRNSVYYVEYGKALLSQGDILTNTLKHLKQEQDEDGEQSEEKKPLPNESGSDAQNSCSDKLDAATSPAKATNSSDQCKDQSGEEGRLPEKLTAQNGKGSDAQNSCSDKFDAATSAVKTTHSSDQCNDQSGEEGRLPEKLTVQNGNSTKPHEEAGSAKVTQSSEGLIKSVGEADRGVEDRELAWQLFETARVIIANDEKMDEKEKSFRLGNVHQLLGEVSLGGGNFDRGYEEFSTSIKLFGKSLQLSDSRIGRAQQLAGLCAVHGRQLEAAQFHYTAAAENYNMRLEELLTEAGVMKPKNPDEPESEDIEFVDKSYLDILKTKVGEESELFKNCSEIYGIVNDLIDRVEELMEEEEQKKVEVAKVMKLLSEKMKNGEIPGAEVLKAKSHSSVNGKINGEVASEQIGFDISQQPATAQVNKLGTFGGVKRLAPGGGQREESVTKKVKTI